MNLIDTLLPYASTEDARLLLAERNSISTYKQGAQVSDAVMRSIISKLDSEGKIPDSISLKVRLNIGEKTQHISSKGKEYTTTDGTDLDDVFCVDSVEAVAVECSSHGQSNTYKKYSRDKRIFAQAKKKYPSIFQKARIQFYGLWIKHLSTCMYSSESILSWYCPRQLDAATYIDEQSLERFTLQLVAVATSRIPYDFKSNKFTTDTSSQKISDALDAKLSERSYDEWCEYECNGVVDYARVYKREFDIEFLYFN